VAARSSRIEALVSFVMEKLGAKRNWRFDTAESGSRRLGQKVVGPALDNLGSQTQGLEFFGGEHQRWKVEAGLQPIADAGVSFDGDAAMDRS